MAILDLIGLVISWHCRIGTEPENVGRWTIISRGATALWRIGGGWCPGRTARDRRDG